MTDDRDDKPKPSKRDQTWQPLSQTARLVETIPQGGKRREAVPVEIKTRLKPPSTSIRSTFSRSQRTGVAIETKRRRPLPKVVESSEPEIVQSGEPPVVDALDVATILDDRHQPADQSANQTLKGASDQSHSRVLAAEAGRSATRTIEEALREGESGIVERAIRDIDTGTARSALEEASRDIHRRPTTVDAIIEAKHRANMDAILSRFDVEHPQPKPQPQMVYRDTNHAGGNIVGRDVSTDVVGSDAAAKAQAEREAREEARRDREIELAEAEHKNNIRNFWLTVVLGILGLLATIAAAVLFG